MRQLLKGDNMNAVFIVPTGIGAEIGGHSGDATPAAKLIASTCDNLIVHPNVVNASDINEMAENMIYVEGSILNKFLQGKIGLNKSYGNRILVAVNEATSDIINSVSGARATIGADIEIVVFDNPLVMTATMPGGVASGRVANLGQAIRQVERHDFDVLVVNTPINTKGVNVSSYLTGHGGVNPWGGVEALLSRLMSESLNRPVIHAPVENSETFTAYEGVVDPRKAAEMVSVCYLHCCLKGAHLAPRIATSGGDLQVKDIDFLITPTNVVGPPHMACIQNNIPVIAVESNRTVLDDVMPENFIIVKSYLEAAGVICARRAGVSIESTNRPLSKTRVEYRS
jgi:hypothetical protein